MEIEKCPDCDGSGYATVRKFRTIKTNGISKKRCLKFYINEKTKELELAFKCPSIFTGIMDEYMICQYCKGKGYLYDRLPYGDFVDIGYCNF